MITSLGNIIGREVNIRLPNAEFANELAEALIADGLLNVHIEMVKSEYSDMVWYHVRAYNYEGQEPGPLIHLTLTSKELEDMVCSGLAPAWLEHRYLHHPDYQCDGKCDIPVIPSHLQKYQNGKG